MFIAHLPAGYILTKWLQKQFNVKHFLWIGLIASVFPDIDLLYFYLIDHRQTMHHHYWTHLPLFWLALWSLVTIGTLLLKRRTAAVFATIIFANILLHFVLDTFVGGINWLYPFLDHDVYFFTVPATHSFWVWSFVFHWTFLVEIIIVIIAIVFLIKDRIKKSYARTANPSRQPRVSPER